MRCKEHEKVCCKICFPPLETIPFRDVLVGAEVLANRREMLCKKPPLCPDCQTDQVQLTEWIEGEVAEWKCRHCKVRFKFERAV